MSKKKQKVSAEDFAQTLSDNEECMGEGAAYYVTCEQMGVDPDEGYDLLADLSGDE